MASKRLWLYVVVVAIACHTLPILAQDPIHQQFTTADGLPSDRVYCATVDGEGFIWFATDAGVARFDGRNFRSFTREDGLSAEDIVNLATDSQGRVWFLSMHGAPDLWENGQIHNSRSDPRLRGIPEDRSFISIAEETPDRFWLAGNDHMLHYLDMAGHQDTTWLGRYLYVTRTSAEDILGVGRDEVVALARSHPMTVRQMEYELRLIAPISTYQPVDPLLVRGQDLVEVGMHTDQVLISKSSLFKPDIHGRVWQDPGGAIWLRRRDLGVDRIEFDENKEPHIRTWFPLLHVNSVYTDKYGGYWICTQDQGVLRISPDLSSSQVWMTSSPGNSGAILSLETDQREQVIAGTAQGKVLHFRSDTLAELWPERGKPVVTGRVHKVARQADMLWVSADFQVLQVGLSPPYSVKSINVLFHALRTDQPFIPPVAKSVTVGPTGNVFTGYTNLYKIQSVGGELMQVPLLDNYRFPSYYYSLPAYPYSLCEDQSGRLWFDQGKLLCCLDKGEIRRFPLPGPNGGTEIRDIEIWSGDTVLVSHGAGGLYMYNNGVVIDKWRGVDAPINEHCQRINVYQDRIWISTNVGLRALGIKAGRFHAHELHVPLGATPPQSVNDIRQNGDAMYVGTDQGLLKLPILSSVEPPPAPHVYWHSVRVGAQEVSAFSTLRLAHDHANVTIQLGAIALGGDHELEFRFRSKAEQEWSFTRSDRIELAALSPGSHVMQAAARLGYGPWSDPMELKFEVAAAWYQRGWVQLLVGLLLMGAGIGVVAGILRMRHRNTILSLQQEELLQRERSRIAADLHDDLGADLSDLLLHARSAKTESGTPQMSLERVENGLLDAMRTVDETIWAVDPKRDTLKATIEHIERNAQHRLEQTGIRSVVHFEVPDETIMIRAAKRRELHLIMKEAVNNAAKHSQARNLELSCSVSGIDLLLMVSDDGVGVKKPSSGHGLRNMKERVVRIGGNFKVEANSPRGTKIVVRVPLNSLTTSDEAT